MAVEGGNAMDRLACHCCGKNGCTKGLVTALALLEKELGELRVTSGFRCVPHNQSAGGKPRSKHCSGKAVDVLIPADVSDRDFIAAARQAGFGGLGIGLKWAHLDLRVVQTIWGYDAALQIIPYAG